jgi:hypothetical protein
MNRLEQEAKLNGRERGKQKELGVIIIPLGATPFEQ